MGDSGNPSDAGRGSEPDPDRPGWASPTPPPPPTPAAPPPPPADVPPPQPPAGPDPGDATTAPAWATPPPAGPVAPMTTPGWGDAPGPPPKKRRLIWLWILIPVLLVMTASTVVAIVFGVKLFIGPIDATDDYYANLRDARFAAAYADLCATAKRDLAVDDYIVQKRRDDANHGRVERFDFTGLEFGSGTFDNTSIDATVTGEVRRGESIYDVRVGLQREGGDWRICEIRER